MNSEKFLRARNSLYANLVRNAIRALNPFLGREVTPDLITSVLGATKPLVDRARGLASSLAYQDYKDLVKTDPVPNLALNRFTDQLWTSTLEKLTEEAAHLSVSVSEEIGMSADYWARDAEFGTRMHLAKADSRIDRVARVDPEPPSCPFCTLLNSRGAVYLSKETAGRTLHKGDECILVLVLQGQTSWAFKENGEAALKEYNTARETAVDGTADAIMHELRKNRPSGSKPGNVRENASSTAKAQGDAKLQDAKSRLAALDKTSPKSAQAQKYRADQIAQNQTIVSALSPALEA